MANEKTDLEKKINEMHPSEGRLRDDGGSRSVRDITFDDKKEVAAYSLRLGNWNPYGGVRNSGITEWQGINVYDGQTEIEVKPMAMWRDGENQHNDQPGNHYFMRELEQSGEGTYKLVLENSNGIIEILQVDFSKKESKLLETLKGSEYLERKEEKTIDEKSALLGRKCFEILHQSNPRGCNSAEKVYVLDLEKMALSKKPWGYSEESSKEKAEWRKKIYNDALKNPEGKLILYVTSEALYGDPIRGKLLVADPSSLKLRQLIDCRYSDSCESLDVSLDKNGLLVSNKYFDKVRNKWEFNPHELKEK